MVSELDRKFKGEEGVLILVLVEDGLRVPRTDSLNL